MPTAGGENEPSVRRIKRRFKPSASVAIVRNDHVLMVREAVAHKQGRWNLPGGTVDPGEGPVQAAIRVTHEETGFDVSIGGLAGIYTCLSSSGRTALRFLFFGDVECGEPRPNGDEVLETRWFHFDQLESMPDSKLWRPAIIRAMLRDIRKAAPLPLDLIQSFDPLAQAA